MPRKTGFATITLIILAAPLTSTFSGSPETIEETKESYVIQEKSISVERFAPKAPGKHPAILILHGSTGPDVTGGGLMYRDLGRELAKQGYVAFMPHYFERTGTKTADLKTSTDNFVTWMETIYAATEFISKRDEIDAEKIGVVGFSLGGYLSLSEPLFDQRVKVVVDYFGGMPEQLVDCAHKLPPTLVLHGEADPIVSVKEAEKVEKLLKQHKIEHEVKIYKGQGHGILGSDGEDAQKRAIAFLDKHLKSS